MTGYGPLMIDIAGTTLTALDRERLSHPLVGGIILFSRNYESSTQIMQLCAEIHALRAPKLLIAVDHEGGRVQRFLEGFTHLPAMSTLGKWWDETPRAAVECARSLGFVLAAELRAVGVDLSFAPVLDLDWGRSEVIGDRAFHAHPQAVSDLAGGLIAGLRDAGMACCGKHFPGHGWAMADSHVAIPVDERDLEALDLDMQPYRTLKLDAVMPAHVIYPAVDTRPAGFSPIWIQKLRNEFKFDGAIFSDDLSMEGAAVAGGFVDRAQAAWEAGCDMLPVCNAPDAVEALLEQWHPLPNPVRSERIAKLMPTTEALTRAALEQRTEWQAGRSVMRRLNGIAPSSSLNRKEQYVL